MRTNLLLLLAAACALALVAFPRIAGDVLAGVLLLVMLASAVQGIPSRRRPR